MTAPLVHPFDWALQSLKREYPKQFTSRHIGKLVAAAFYQITESDGPDIALYLEQHGVCTETANSIAGPFGIHDVQFRENGLFDFDLAGDPAIIFVVQDVDAETPLDLAAFCPSETRQYGTLVGNAGLLGCDQVTRCNRVHTPNHLLPIHRTPLKWLRAACRGLCILNVGKAQAVLRHSYDPLLAEDVEHGAALARALSPAVPDSRVFVRIEETERASA